MPRRLYWLVLLLSVLILAACRARQTPAPAPAPTTTLRPVTPVPTSTRNVIVTPNVMVTPLPAGWKEHRGTDFLLYLPPEWTVLEVGQAEAERRFAELQQEDPLSAGIIGNADALAAAVLWAFAPVTPGATFTDSLNIRRTALAGRPRADMAAVIAPIVEQYRRLNFTEVAAESDLRIGARPAAHITYRFPVRAGDDEPIEVTGHQYLIATDTDLWILSYTAGPDSTPGSAEVFSQSAQSFEPDL